MGINKELFFPVDVIGKGSDIVIYGAGRNGRILYETNKELAWCNIVGVVDSKYEQIDDFPIEVRSPQDVLTLDKYDYILISVYNGAIKQAIKEYILSLGVDERKIISCSERFLISESEVIDTVSKSVRGNKLKICFYPGGVMGDNVIALRLYKELVRLAPNSVIDVMTGFEGFPEILYGKQKNIGKIVHRWLDENDREDYDVIIQSHFEPSLIYYNKPDTARLAPELAIALDVLYKYQTTDFFFCTPAQYMNRIQWDRAKFLDKNCYTILDSSGAFGINDKIIDFNVTEEYEEEYHKLGLNEKYVTFNYGASDPLKDGKNQIKMWLYEYHCEFNRLFKQAFPKIELVQIGAKNATKIPGADRYVIGPHLEVTKHVLKNALLHIDCEGGLVHIASQLGTKCVVLFGPTPVGFFGYKNNVNIVADSCKECCGLVSDWYTRCYKYDKAKCMSEITPEMVMKEVTKELGKGEK